MSNFLKDFGASFAKTYAAGAQSGSGTSTSLGRMLKDGTQDDFNKYLSARQGAVKGEYDAYKTKFDAFESQAKTLIDIIGDDAIDKGTHLTSQEATARLMKGKTTAGVDKLIAGFSEHRKEGTNIRELLGATLERGKSDKEVFNLTPQEIAKGALGGSFKYTPKPFDLKERRTGLARFLRDDLGLFSETFEGEREGVAKKQAEMITAGFNEKYTGDTDYREARGVISLDPAKMRTQAEIRDERKSIAQTEGAETNVKIAKQSLLHNASSHAMSIDLHRKNMTLTGMKIDEAKIVAEENDVKRKLGLPDLKRAVVDAIGIGDPAKIAESVTNLEETQNFLNSKNAISGTYTKLIENDAALTTKYKPGRLADGASPGFGQEGLSTAEATKVRKSHAVNATYRVLSRFRDQELVDSLPYLMPSYIPISRDEFNTMKIIVSANNSSKADSLNGRLKEYTDVLMKDSTNKEKEGFIARVTMESARLGLGGSVSVANKVKVKDDETINPVPTPTPKRRVTQEQNDADKAEIARLEKELKIEQETLSLYRAGEKDKTGDSRSNPIERGIARDSMLEIVEKLEERRSKLKNSEVIVPETI